MTRNFDLKIEDQLLLNCSSTKISDERIRKIQNLITRDLDWDYIVKMAQWHRLSYLLYWQLNEICPEKVPEDVKLKLQEDFNFNAKRNLAILRELVIVLDILQKRGITPIPYKGPVLAIMAYKNIGFRRFGDLDFYVRWEDVPRTKDILIENGYKSLMKLTPNQETAFYKFQREYHFKSKSTGITLEIKWKLFSTYHSINYKPFLSKPDFLKEIKIDSFILKTIAPEYLILLLSVHNATHFFSSLYRFCDLSELIISMDHINWQNLMNLADEIDTKRIFLVNMFILRELFMTPLPNNVIEEINCDKSVEKISKEIIHLLFSQKSIGKLEKVLYPLKLRERFLIKFKNFLFFIFLPTPEVIESVSLPRILQPLYYIIRVFYIFRI